MMKTLRTLLSFCLILFTGIAASAQQATEGVITYEVKMNMHRRLPKEREAMKSMIPEYRTTKHNLFFNAQETLWKPVEDAEADLNLDNGGGMVMRMRTPMSEIYNNQSQEKRISLREFMGKEYLVTDSVRLLPWKLTEETKTILGYTCKQAKYTDEKRNATFVAWYTDKLRLATGPENYNALPGTVLEVNMNDGERIITAQKVDLRPLKKGELKEPSKGQKVTEREYQRQMEEQMKKMGGGNGNMIIRNF